MAEWWSIEVLHGEFSAFRWQEQHDSALIEAALTNGAVDGSWHADRWGVVFEICFENEERWEAFRALPAVRAALDGVPDPLNGLLVYRGRGGGAGAREPRPPKPTPAASAVSLPTPQAEPHLDLTRITPPDPVHAATAGASGSEYVRRRLAQDAAATSAAVNTTDLARFAEVSDLADPDVMSRAWR
jgi:hypothetical protein